LGNDGLVGFIIVLGALAASIRQVDLPVVVVVEGITTLRDRHAIAGLIEYRTLPVIVRPSAVRVFAINLAIVIVIDAIETLDCDAHVDGISPTTGTGTLRAPGEGNADERQCDKTKRLGHDFSPKQA